MRLWILNHYATDMYFDESGRHHAFAKYLIRMGHDVKIFCANTVHNSDVVVNLQGNQYIEKTGADHVPYVFVKARPYQGNGKNRILNMVDYFRNIKYVLNDYKKEEGMPDIILASSVHPLTLVAGIKWAHKNNIKCICEVRDLWPETFIDFGCNEKSIIMKALYLFEKSIYKRADSVIFTMEGGKEYIVEKKWDDVIPLSKIYYLNNGVDLKTYEESMKNNEMVDDDLDDDLFTVIYVGSIRPANGVDNIVKCAPLLGEDIKVLIYGDGIERESLQLYCRENNISNVIFKGRVEKKYISYILSKGDVNLLNYKQCKIDRFGTSQNKLFEYLASGKPIVANVDMGYDIIKKYGCGISKAFANSEEYVAAINSIKELKQDEYLNLCQYAWEAARNFDYEKLTEILEDIIYKTINK